LVTNEQAPDGHGGEKTGTVSVSSPAVRLRGGNQEGDVLRYALLVYGNTDVIESTPDEERQRINASVNEVLARPNVTGWLRLQDVGSATTVSLDQGRTLLTDGPFVDSKDFLGGFIVVEADDLDGALAVAGELQVLRLGGAIEVRPVREEPLTGA
jgi:hypothetical protein